MGKELSAWAKKRRDAMTELNSLFSLMTERQRERFITLLTEVSRDRETPATAAKGLMSPELLKLVQLQRYLQNNK
ncbi:MAG TPA: hypothetical protein VNX65_00865 [Patescibacteria group bacterium]|nr:hypothetical protein [Patescibacteria group bacterium]